MFDPGTINDDAFDYYARLRKLRGYVEEHLCEPISLSDAAEVVGLEPTYFSRFFHCKTGVCFHHWLHYIRVCRAIDILKINNHTITDISHAVGFQDLRTFERAFKKCTGVTPWEFKKEARPA